MLILLKIEKLQYQNDGLFFYRTEIFYILFDYTHQRLLQELHPQNEMHSESLRVDQLKILALK